MSDGASTAPSSEPDLPPVGAPGDALGRLRALVEEQGGLLASLLAPCEPAPGAHTDRAATPSANGPAGSAGSANGAGPPQLAAAGPRAAASPAEYELLLEAIYEGYLLHYAAPRLLRAPEADLGLLAGDQLYALGLARLVKLGDLEAVAELADVITLTALAHGAGRADLAYAIWTAGARAVGWGPSGAHGRAKELARAGEAGALEAMRAAAQPDRR